MDTDLINDLNSCQKNIDVFFYISLSQYFYLSIRRVVDMLKIILTSLRCKYEWPIIYLMI